MEARLLEHVRAHHQVREPVAAGVRAVGADAADLGREVEDELRPDLVEQPRCLRHVGEVELEAPGNGDLVALRLEPLHEVRAEEAAAARDEDPAHGVSVGAPVGSQSTRPIQRSRFSAYQRIVRSTPSSHDTFGSQPVSRVSFSCPTRSAITSLAPGR